MNETNPTTLRTAAETATFLGISEIRLRKLRRTAELRGLYYEETGWMYRDSDIRAYLDPRPVQPKKRSGIFARPSQIV